MYPVIIMNIEDGYTFQNISNSGTMSFIEYINEPKDEIIKTAESVVYLE